MENEANILYFCDRKTWKKVNNKINFGSATLIVECLPMYLFEKLSVMINDDFAPLASLYPGAISHRVNRLYIDHSKVYRYNSTVSINT